MFNTQQILTSAGIDSIKGAFGSLSSDSEKGVMASLLVGGVGGAFDAAVQYGLDSVPGVANEVAKEALKNLDLTKAPALLENLVNGGLNGGLSEVVKNISSSITPENINLEALTSKLSSTELGEVSQIFQNFSNQPSLNFLASGVPSTASSLMGATGLLGPWSAAIPTIGLGTQLATSLLGGQNPISSILNGGGAFGSLFGGGTNNLCPCDPKCRKTSHGKSSNGQNALDSAGSLVINNSNTYGSDILNNNSTCLAQEAGLSFSGIGNSLIPSNILNLTNAINSIEAVNNAAERLEKAVKGGAEQQDLMLELMYALEGFEKAFKFADNNISQVEWIEHLGLLGSKGFMNDLIIGRNSLLDQNRIDTTEHAQAITDLYEMIGNINSKLYSGPLAIAPTPAILAAQANITEIPSHYNMIFQRIFGKSWKDILKAIDILSSLDPEFGVPFNSEETKFNQSKVLNDSISSKLSSSQPTEDSVNFSFNKNNSLIKSLSNSQLNSGDFDELLSQIKNEQKAAKERKGTC